MGCFSEGQPFILARGLIGPRHLLATTRRVSGLTGDTDLRERPKPQAFQHSLHLALPLPLAGTVGCRFASAPCGALPGQLTRPNRPMRGRWADYGRAENRCPCANCRRIKRLFCWGFFIAMRQVVAATRQTRRKKRPRVDTQKSISLYWGTIRHRIQAAPDDGYPNPQDHIRAAPDD